MKTIKKLSLNKNAISKLNQESLSNLFGGNREDGDGDDGGGGTDNTCFNTCDNTCDNTCGCPPEHEDETLGRPTLAWTCVCAHG